jgi:hypothetical protein
VPLLERAVGAQHHADWRTLTKRTADFSNYFWPPAAEAVK